MLGKLGGSLSTSALVQALGLPEAPPPPPAEVLEQLREQFRDGIGTLNLDLQAVAAQGSKGEFKSLEQQRDTLFQAFQKLAETAPASQTEKLQGSTERLLDALKTVQKKASDVAGSVASGREDWLMREEGFDQAMLKIGELEDAKHPKAPTLRKVGEAIRKSANENTFTEAVKLFDGLGPKLDAIVIEQGLVEPDAINAGPPPAAPPIPPVQPRDGGSPEGDGPALGEEVEITDGLLRDILEVIAEREGLDLSELGDLKDLKDLPGDLLDTINEIASSISPIAATKDAIKKAIEEAAKTIGKLIGKIVDGIKKIIEKRRVPQFCVVSVQNNTDKKLSLVKEEFPGGKGGWVTPPKRTLGPGETDQFEARSPTHRPVLGVVAKLLYEFDEDKKGPRKDLKWHVDFANQRDFAIKAESKVKGKDHKEYQTPPPKKTEGDTAAFAFQLNLASDENPPEPELPEVKDDDNKGGGENGGGGGNENGGGGATPVADLQASCMVTVTNKTDDALSLIDQGHERGDFMTFPDGGLAAGESLSFVSVETQGSEEQGCKGFLLWEIEGTGCQWRVEWDNPEQEKNGSTSTIDGDRAKEFRGLDQIGQGDENVPVAFTLSTTGSGEKPTTPDKPVIDPNAPREGLTVVVRDSQSGDAIEGASVAVGDQSDTTSSLGLATVELPVGEHAYEASAEGYAAKKDKVTIIEGDNPELIVELTADNTPREGLTIMVRDAETQTPIEGASVTAGDQSDTSSSLGLTTFELPVGEHAYEVTAEGYESAKDKVTVIEGDNAEVIVDLTKKAAGKTELVFTVTDQETKEPVKDAKITIGEQSSSTDGQGKATFEVDEDTHWYRVSSEAYEDKSDVATAEEDKTVEVPVELEKEPEFNPPPESDQPTLRKGDDSADGWVEYLQARLNKQFGERVVDSNGVFDEKVKEWVIKFQEREGLLVDGIVGNQTWAQLRGAPPRDPGTDGHDPHSHVESGAEARWMTEKTDFFWYNENEDELEAWVVSVGQDPIDDFEAVLRITTPNGTETLDQKIGPSSHQSSSGDSTSHQVRIPGYRETYGPGTHKIHAYLPEELGGDNWKGEIEVPPGFDDKNDQAHLHVTVMDADGAPVDGAVVRVTSKSGSIELDHTNKKGLAKVGIVTAVEEAQTVEALLKETAWGPEKIAAGTLKKGETLELTLDKPSKAVIGSLEVLVEREGSDTPVEGCMVHLKPFNMPASRVEKSGVANFDGLPTGEYEVYVFDIYDDSASDPPTGTVKVEEGKTTKLTITIPKPAGGSTQQAKSTGGAQTPKKSSGGTATLEVHVLDAQGEPVKGAKVKITDGPTKASDEQTNGSGIATFNVEVGDYQVKASLKNRSWKPSRVKSKDLVAGQRRSIKIKE